MEEQPVEEHFEYQVVGADDAAPIPSEVAESAEKIACMQSSLDALAAALLAEKDKTTALRAQLDHYVRLGRYPLRGSL